ncbi:MAG: AarF/ABC1/UbiB kinase family protein [Candidatus Hydrogenedentes bacterium]|jgi:ubiquinone biosynthesis protein|nr:AarF/ABC1/UbiB kinase family protein [Candidatus Hydrogenedentota bacterium]
MFYSKLGRHKVNVVRFAEITQVLLRHGFSDILCRAGLDKGWPGKILKRMKIVETPHEEPSTFGSRLRETLIELGPSFIKLGQVLSTRSDLVGSTLAMELSRLQDDVTPDPFTVFGPLIEEELGKSIDTVFQSINCEPVASASLSQVYHGVLVTGEEVAVKVQRPDIHQIIKSDISLLRTVAEWIAKHQKGRLIINPVGIVEEFSRSITRELDFTLEARAAFSFAENFADVKDIVIPRPFPDLCTPKLLVLEWVEGVPINCMEDYEPLNSSPAAVSAVGCHALFEMIFSHQLFHADPHPGNVFLLKDNRIAFLDLGMAGHLELSDVYVFSDILLSVFNGDTEQCLNSLLFLAGKEDLATRDELRYELSEFIAFEAPLILSQGLVARGLELMVQVMGRHRLEINPRFSLLIKALITIEIVGRELDPSLDMIKMVRPYVESMILKRYHPTHLLQELKTHTLGYLRLSRQAPTDVAHLLRQLRSGKMKVHIHHDHLEALAVTIDRASKRNAVAVVAAALFVGSSMLFLADAHMEELALIGYIASGLLSVGLVLSILWRSSFGKD